MSAPYSSVWLGGPLSGHIRGLCRPASGFYEQRRVFRCMVSPGSVEFRTGTFMLLGKGEWHGKMLHSGGVPSSDLALAESTRSSPGSWTDHVSTNSNCCTATRSSPGSRLLGYRPAWSRTRASVLRVAPEGRALHASALHAAV